MPRKPRYDERFFYPDGRIKRLMKVVEVLPDGTKVFENGQKALPSVVEYADGTQRRLDSFTPEEKKEWLDKLMKNTGRIMSDFIYNELPNIINKK